MFTAPLLAGALTFGTWAVYLGGLASMQADCDSRTLTNGLMSATTCSKSYKMQWFYMSWQFAAIAILVAAIVSQKLNNLRTAIVGLFAVATVLFIDVASTMLDGQDLPYWSKGTPYNRIRTTTAGAIMTATMNAIVMIVIGWAANEVERPVAEKTIV